MPLTLLTGPAGSGKTGEVLERLAASLEPGGSPPAVLVVPTRADVERFEDELLARRPVAVGARIVTFDRLVSMVASAAGVVGPARLTPAQRLALMAAVAADADLEVLAEPARRSGFAEALDRFVAECQASLVTPEELESRLGRGADGGTDRRAYLRELAALYGGYVRRRDALGRSDGGSLAAAAVVALRERPGTWGSRPLFVHGFDDLTAAQLALLGTLVGEAEVLVSLVHEEGRACLAARTRLLERLRRIGDDVEEAEPGAQLALDDAVRSDGAARRIDLTPPRRTSLLGHIERSFLTDLPKRREPTDELRLLAASGIRNEVEQVGAALVRLLRSGTPPDQIAVISRSPESVTSLVTEVFGRFGIPVATHTRTRLADAPAGRGLVALLRAAITSRAAADLIAFLRCPGRAAPRAVDDLERWVRSRGVETAADAERAWHDRGGRRLWELDEIRAAGEPRGLLERLVRIARAIAEHPHHRKAPALGAAASTDLTVAEAAAEALAEIAELATDDPELLPSPEELASLIGGLRLPAPHAGVAGRVELMDPYRARARQFPYVFVLSLQEGEFPRRRRDDPFLTVAERSAAGLPEPADQRDEERYLFYVCLTRATRCLHLSYRVADEEGQALTRSFFVDEVLDLLAPGSEGSLVSSKGLSETVFPAGAAPTRVELARSLAERQLLEVPEALAASPALRETLEARLAVARERADWLPGPLDVRFVVEQFAARRQIGASSLETNAECSFRYFVDHELSPRELAPVPEPLVRGGIAHKVLERVYQELGGERPTPATVDATIERARAVLHEIAADSALDPERPTGRPALRRVESDVERFLRYDAALEGGRVVGVEAAFGAGEDDDKPPLPLGGFELHGKIDRIDLVEPGRALIRDYKTGSKVASRKTIREERKLQLPLYMLAVRELWGLEPVGGVYHPLGAQYEGVPRGLLRGPRDTFPVSERFVGTDYTNDEQEFENALDEARTVAGELAARIHSGHLDRDPLGGSCPEHCDFHPICRRERGEKNPEDRERPDEASDE